MVVPSFIRHLFPKKNNVLATDSQILSYMEFDEKAYPLQKETHSIIGLCMKVHRNLGPGLLEIVYKDALEIEFKNNAIQYEREKEYLIEYKDVILPHRFYADFIVYGSIILEAKSTKRFYGRFLFTGHKLSGFIKMQNWFIGKLWRKFASLQEVYSLKFNL